MTYRTTIGRIVLFFLVLYQVAFANENHPLELAREKNGRLLVCILSTCSFTPEEFSSKTGAKLVFIEERNPYKTLQDLFIHNPFTVLSKPIKEEVLRNVSRRYGYQYICFSSESLEDATKKTDTLLTEMKKGSSSLAYLSKKEAKKLYALMGSIDKILSKNGIIYFAMEGTLLGAIRHHGIIPWDDDLDIGILDYQEEMLRHLSQIFRKNGLKLFHCGNGFYKIFPKNGKKISHPNEKDKFLPYRYPFCDVFVLSLTKKKEYLDAYQFKDTCFYYENSNEWVSFSQITNRKKVPFGPISLYVVDDPESVLSRTYGLSNFPELWKRYAMVHSWDHKNEKPREDCGATFLDIEDFSPAPY
jgi:hypothetical protein